MPHKDFDAQPDQVGHARAFVRAQVVTSAITDDVVTVTSELATNAIRHARTPFTVSISEGEPIRLEVSDFSSMTPTMKTVPTQKDGGYASLPNLADRSGTEISPDSKTVWAEFDPRVHQIHDESTVFRW